MTQINETNQVLTTLLNECRAMDIYGAVELDTEEKREAFNGNSHMFDGVDYFIMYDIQGDNDVALMKFPK